MRIGQGVGAALCVNDEVVDGQAFTAGEIGHITIDPTGPVCACGRPGCLETFLSSSRLHAMIAENPQRRTQILSEAGQTLGRVLAIPAGLLDLDNIAVYGPPEIVSEAFLGSMNEELSASISFGNRTAPRLYRCQQGEDLVLRGQAVVVIRTCVPTIRESDAGPAKEEDHP